MQLLHFYETNGEEKLFSKTEPSVYSDVEAVEIVIYKEKKCQKIIGFGGSFTDSSAYLIQDVLSKVDCDDVMNLLFDAEKGIGLSVIRNPMGASDYARTIYSYQDSKDDTFSIDHDKAAIIPLTRQAVSLNPETTIMASPWSAPGWMKTSGVMNGGKLLEEYYAAYATYFVNYVKENAQHGLEIAYVTPQNEPLYEPLHYPSMHMSVEEQITFVKGYLKPAFEKEGLRTKILSLDHNWNYKDFPLQVFDEAYDAFDGVAWHWYGGDPSSQDEVYRAYPDKEVHFTEGSGGEWIPAFEPAFSNLMRTGIDILRHHSRSFILWNMALDESNGPFVPGFGESTCRGIITINQINKNYELTLDYYGLAHFSKFIRPGAVRVASTETKQIRSVAFENKDGSFVAVVFNDSDEERNVKIEDVQYTSPAKSAQTIVWR